MQSKRKGVKKISSCVFIMCVLVQDKLGPQTG